MSEKPNGVILWEGPSAIDGAPTVVLATGLARPSANRKTGPMIQTWILRADVEPTEAIRTGDDASICGACPLRGILGQARACYVNVGQAPLAVYRAFRRGAYPRIERLTGAALRPYFAGRAVRFGAYGDPAAAPYRVWSALGRTARTWTGYTHQWRTLNRRWARWLMASTDANDRAEAIARGWRTFTVSDETHPDDVYCPADSGRTTCDRCSLCRGTASGAKSVSIRPHGSGAKYAGGAA